MKAISTTPNGSPIGQNIVPKGQAYTSGAYTLTTVASKCYFWTKVDGTSLVVNGSTTLTVSGFFVATATTVTMNRSGGGSAAITDSVTLLTLLYPATFTPTLPTRQVTVGEFQAGNPNWMRQHQISDQAHFCKRGTIGVALLLSDMANLALTQEVGLTWTPPVILTQPVSASCLGNASAAQTLTNDGTNVSNSDTVIVGAKTYTFQTTLTNVDGNVHIGASNTASMTNLFNAVNATGGTPGTDYAAAMTANSQVAATNPTGTTVIVTAKVAGLAGNAIPTTETSTHLSWGSATLTGGTDLAASFSVSAGSEYDLSYLWQYSSDLITWNNITGTANGCPYTGYNTATLSTGVPTTRGQNGVYHRCITTDDAGNFGLTNGSVTSDGSSFLTIN